MTAVKAPEKAPEFTPIELPDITMRPSTRQKLKGARNLIQKGWIKGRFHMPTGERYGIEPSSRTARVDRYCVLGALDAVGAGHRSEAARLFSEVAGVSPSGIIVWNDSPNRRKAHVLAVFDELLAE